MKKITVTKAVTRKIIATIFFLSGLSAAVLNADYNFINQTPYNVDFDINHKHGGLKANTNTKFSIPPFTPRQHKTDGTVINVKATVQDPKKKQVVTWIESGDQNTSGRKAVFWVKSWLATDPAKVDPATGRNEQVTVYTIEMEPRDINATDDIGALSVAKKAHEVQAQQGKGQQQQQGGGYGQQQGRGGW